MTTANLTIAAKEAASTLAEQQRDHEAGQQAEREEAETQKTVNAQASITKIQTIATRLPSELFSLDPKITMDGTMSEYSFKKHKETLLAGPVREATHLIKIDYLYPPTDYSSDIFLLTADQASAFKELIEEATNFRTFDRDRCANVVREPMIQALLTGKKDAEIKSPTSFVIGVEFKQGSVTVRTGLSGTQGRPEDLLRAPYTLVRTYTLEAISKK